MEGKAVGHEREAEQIEVLASGAEAVCPAESERVVEVAVDGFGVVSAWVEASEVRVAGRDGSDVFGPLTSGFVVQLRTTEITLLK